MSYDVSMMICVAGESCLIRNIESSPDTFGILISKRITLGGESDLAKALIAALLE
jgi:hypothetical protein